MVAWFLTAILTVGLFAYISLTGVSIVSNTQNSAQRSEAVRRLDMVVQGLQSQSAAPLPDGVVYAPVGTLRNGQYGLPSSLLPVGVTAFGSKFVYCPMGNTGGATNDSVTFNGGSYPVGVAELNDQSFVVSGRASTAAAADPNVIAFVIAPESSEVGMPGCNDVVRNGDAYTAPNGIVRALRRASITDLDAIRSDSGNTWYVTPDGRGNGQSPSTPASLSSAVAAYRASLGGTFSIVLAPGTYSSGESMFDQTVTAVAAKKESSALVLTSATAAAIRVAGAINLPNSVEVRNIDLTGTPIYADTGHYLRSTNSSLGPVIAEARSRVILSGSNVVRANAGGWAIYQQSGSALSLSNGTLTVSYANGANAAWRLEAGASSLIAASTLNLQPMDSAASSTTQYQLLATDPTAQMVFKSSQINVNGPAQYPIMVGGRFTAYTTTIAINAGATTAVQGTNGGRIDLPQITIGGSRPATYALSTVGAATMTGFGNLAASGRCWYRGEGSLFRYSSVGYQGQASQMTDNENPPPMDPQPTAQQIQRYQASVARNVERTSLRASLITPGSSFICQSAPAVTYQVCAVENGDCDLRNAIASGQTTTVRYGANNSWYSRTVGPEGVACNNATFGDPIVGTVKQCQFMVN
jgi:hypothetical protein